MRIDAAVVNEEGSPFSIEELELDDPGPDEILVRIVTTGGLPSLRTPTSSTRKSRSPCRSSSATRAQGSSSASGSP